MMEFGPVDELIVVRFCSITYPKIKRNPLLPSLAHDAHKLPW